MTTLEDVKSFLNENKESEEVKSYLKENAAGFGISSEPKEIDFEGAKSFLETNKDSDNVRQYMNSISDRRVTDAIKTYESGTLKNKLEAQRAELEKEFASRGKETPEQKANRELRERMAGMELERKKDKVSLFASTYANEKNVPISLVLKSLTNVDFSPESIDDIKESAKKEIDSISEVFEKTVKTRIEAEFQKGGYTPKGSQSPASTMMTEQRVKELADKARSTGKDKDIAAYYKAKTELTVQQQKT